MPSSHHTQGRRPLAQIIAQAMLRMTGWKAGPFPDIDRAVIAGGPHTSNWDGVIALVSRSALQKDVNIMIKHSLFKGPLGWLLRKLGAIPIERGRAGGVVTQTVAQFKKRERLLIAVTPEGTRSNAEEWKLGFYHIAKRANVPIILALADYEKKTFSFPVVIHPSDDMEADLREIYRHFATVTPRHPDKLSVPVQEFYGQ
ncbi:lysophospholipid acyltransferase family protein [Alcanivorax sp. S6407]|uniref:lysophospholipid acyltransferase family protein n=1 Tax=Alcanivorax sp. S6407 TaxID=2926424 RepID=UPI001FF355E2|nr:lysophospholipid acyltransferase family protein [Alcanivorax sp. S6407]MCK0154343.1 lysophospholipid acyltransferase family protein [Alcanivorax sp. S6407]